MSVDDFPVANVDQLTKSTAIWTNPRDSSSTRSSEKKTLVKPLISTHTSSVETEPTVAIQPLFCLLMANVDFIIVRGSSRVQPSVTAQFKKQNNNVALRWLDQSKEDATPSRPAIPLIGRFIQISTLVPNKLSSSTIGIIQHPRNIYCKIHNNTFVEILLNNSRKSLFARLDLWAIMCFYNLFILALVNSKCIKVSHILFINVWQLHNKSSPFQTYSTMLKYVYWGIITEHKYRTITMYKILKKKGKYSSH